MPKGNISPGVLALQVYTNGMISIARRRKPKMGDTINLIKANVTQAIKVAVDEQRLADATLLDAAAEKCIDLNQRSVCTKMAKLLRGEIKLEDIVAPSASSLIVTP